MFIKFVLLNIMPRTEKNRKVHEPPRYTEFKPTGVKESELKQVVLSLDEFEALRLADNEGYSHAEAADEMEISRSTFSRLIVKARKKVSDLLIKGSLLRVEGGNVHFKNNIIHCKGCGHMFKIKISNYINQCPTCQSNEVLNLAGGFGHGSCCNPT